MRRGLIKRENEILLLLQSEDLDILYLTETDSKKINLSNYNLNGYNTILQSCEEENDTIRIIALVKDSPGLDIKERLDIMSKSFPLVWLEVHDKHKSKTVVGGFYRQWSADGKLTVPEQI